MVRVIDQTVNMSWQQNGLASKTLFWFQELEFDLSGKCCANAIFCQFKLRAYQTSQAILLIQLLYEFQTAWIRIRRLVTRLLKQI